MPDLLDANPVPLHEQLECARRELSMRRNVYPRRIASGVMTAPLAARETARMEAIVQTLERLFREQEKAAQP